MILLLAQTLLGSRPNTVPLARSSDTFTPAQILVSLILLLQTLEGINVDSPIRHDMMRIDQEAESLGYKEQHKRTADTVRERKKPWNTED